MYIWLYKDYIILFVLKCFCIAQRYIFFKMLQTVCKNIEKDSFMTEPTMDFKTEAFPLQRLSKTWVMTFFCRFIKLWMLGENLKIRKIFVWYSELIFYSRR